MRRRSKRLSAPTLQHPLHIVDTMAFMFETRVLIRPTRFAMESPQRQRDYAQCWQGLRSHFDSGQALIWTRSMQHMTRRCGAG